MRATGNGGRCSRITSRDVLSRTNRSSLARASCFAALGTTLEHTPAIAGNQTKPSQLRLTTQFTIQELALR